MKHLARFAANFAVVAVSMIVGLLLCEGGVRLLLDSSDYLSVNTVTDDVLGIRIAPGSAGFDEWGFRNRSVPASPDFVAIGDSHTYGNNATMADSWPYVAARASGLEGYNLGLGGYGPNQYFHLLKTRALSLKPRWVVVAIYMGDDFENAFLMTYGKTYWSFLRQGDQGEANGVDADIWGEPADDTKRFAVVRDWLSQHSVVYRVVVHGPVLGALKGMVQIRQAAAAEDPAVTSLVVAGENIQEAFRPIGIRARLDPKSAPVREGMRITFDLLHQMRQLARQNGIELAVAIIPTKETVFADYLLKDPQIRLREVIADLVANERVVTAELVDFLDRVGIPHIETLPQLRSQVSQQLYTRSDGDMHPGRNGYRVIGETIAQFLRRESSRAAGSLH